MLLLWCTLALGVALVHGQAGQVCYDQGDINIIIDSSQSITFMRGGTNYFQQARETAATIARNFEIGEDKVRMSGIKFCRQSEIEFYLYDHYEGAAVQNRFMQLSSLNCEGTAMYKAVRNARTKVFTKRGVGDRGWAPNVIIIISDGNVHIGSDLTKEEVEDARRNGIEIYTVGLTNDINRDYLRDLSGENNYFEVNQIESMVTRIKTSLFKYCFTTTYQSTSTLTPTLTPTIPSTSIPTGTPRSDPAPTSTVTPTPSLRPCDDLDIVFLLDASGSIRDNNPPGGKPDNWELLVQFVSIFTNALVINEESNHVGAILFGNSARKLWGLTDYTDKVQLIARINKLVDDYPLIGENTNTQDALKMARTEIFNTDADRPRSANIVIIITDGVSTVEPLQTIPEATAVKNEGAEIYAVGVGLVDTTELMEMSSEPRILGENYFTSVDFQDLNLILNVILKQTCGGRAPTVTIPPPTLPPTTIITTVPPCEDLDIVFVLDGSGSIKDADPGNWDLVVGFVRDFVQSLEIGQRANHVGAVLFGNEGKKLWGLTEYLDKNALITRINALTADYADIGENTNTQGGLEVMRTEVFGVGDDRPNSKDMAIVVTDGKSTVEVMNTIPAARRARDAGIQIFAVGVTDQIDENELGNISSQPQVKGRNYFTAASFDALQDILIQVLAQTCGGRGVTVPTPAPNPISPGPIARTTPNTPANCRDVPRDIVFVVDGSGSIRDTNEGNVDNWQLMVNFIREIINQLQIGANSNQIGAVLFGNGARKLWGLNQYTDKGDLLTRVNNMINDYNDFGERTNTQAGLNLMMSEVFNTNEDRSGYPNVALVITDGLSTQELSPNTIQVANQAKAQGIKIFAVGITKDANEDELKGMSSPPQQKDLNYFMAAAFTNLNTIITAISELSC